MAQQTIIVVLESDKSPALLCDSMSKLLSRARANVVSIEAAETRLEPYATSVGVMSFGKHKGKPFDKVPASYYDWIMGEPDIMAKHPDVAQYINDNIQHINEELDAEQDGEG